MKTLLTGLAAATLLALAAIPASAQQYYGSDPYHRSALGSASADAYYFSPRQPYVDPAPEPGVPAQRYIEVPNLGQTVYEAPYRPGIASSYRQVPTYGFQSYSVPAYVDEDCRIVGEPTPYGWRRLRVCE